MAAKPAKGRGKSNKPANLAEDARKALIAARNGGEDITKALMTIASCYTQMHEGYPKEVVTPTGETVEITERDLKGAAGVAREYIKLVHELTATAGTATPDEDSEPSFIQKPLILPIDSRVARAERELLEVEAHE